MPDTTRAPGAAAPAPSPPDGRLIPVDSEHFAIRLLVPVLVVVATVLTHLAGTWALDTFAGDNTSALCVMLPLDLLVLLTSGILMERVLKRLLPSKRSARLSSEAVTLTDARGNPPAVETVHWDRLLNVNSWYFVVRRRTRVPKGWYCMALHLLQDETALIFYTFMAPKDAEALAAFPSFVRLRPRHEAETGADPRQIATQRRLLKLEDDRWKGGAEIAPADFAALVARLQTVVPGWG